MLDGGLLVASEFCQQALDFCLELRYSPLQKAPDRRIVDSAIRVSQLVSECDDRARVGDAVDQLRLVLRAARRASPAIWN